MANWLGMESHPTDDWAFYRNNREDLEEARMNYELALSGDKDALEELIRWARNNAENEARYEG